MNTGMWKKMAVGLTSVVLGFCAYAANPCIEKGPHDPSAWQYGNGTPKPGVLSQTSFCVNVGEAPAKPSATPTTFDPGFKIRAWNYDCPSPWISNELVAVNYAPSSLYFIPNIPAKYTLAGSYTVNARVDGIPSDPDAATLTAILGDVTYTVYDPDPKNGVCDTLDVGAIINSYYSGIDTAVTAALKLVPACSYSKPDIKGKIEVCVATKCCDTKDSATVKQAKGSVSMDLNKFSCPVPGWGYKYKDWFYVGFTVFCGGKAEMHVTGIKDNCQKTMTGCFGGSVSGEIGATLGVVSKINACKVGIEGDVSQSASISFEKCDPPLPNQGVPVHFKIGPLESKGKAWVDIGSYKCSKALWKITVLPAIDIPINPPGLGSIL